MKFDRLQLIARIDEIEAENRASFETKLAENQAAWDAHVTEWRKTGSKQLAAALRGLAARAAKGERLTEELIDEALGTGYHSKPQDRLVYTDQGLPNYVGARSRRGASQRPEAEYVPISTLAALRALLVASSDDEISSSGLRDLGFAPSTFIKAAV